MKKLVFSLLTFLLLLFHAQGGEGDLQSNDCKIESVTVSDDRISFVVTGEAVLLLAKDSRGNASQVHLPLEHVTIVVKRRFYDSRPPEERERTWKELCAKALTMQSKTMWIGCYDATTVIEGYRIHYVSCNGGDFGESGK